MNAVSAVRHCQEMYMDGPKFHVYLSQNFHEAFVKGKVFLVVDDKEIEVQGITELSLSVGNERKSQHGELTLTIGGMYVKVFNSIPLRDE